MIIRESSEHMCPLFALGSASAFCQEISFHFILLVLESGPSESLLRFHKSYFSRFPPLFELSMMTQMPQTTLSTALSHQFPSLPLNSCIGRMSRLPVTHSQAFEGAAALYKDLGAPTPSTLPPQGCSVPALFGRGSIALCWMIVSIL